MAERCPLTADPLSWWTQRQTRPKRSEGQCLVLTRKAGESVFIGHDVSVTIVKVNGRQVRLKIDAPRDIPILRDELCTQEFDFDLDEAGSGGQNRRIDCLTR